MVAGSGLYHFSICRSNGWLLPLFGWHTGNTLAPLRIQVRKLGVFCTGPAIRSTFNNLVTEIVGTFLLVFAVFYLAAPSSSLGALDALPVGLLILGIGVSLGGPTGYAINPARDLGPRIMHFLLPMKNKRDSDWNYAWIPVAGPLVGGLLAAWAFMALA